MKRSILLALIVVLVSLSSVAVAMDTTTLLSQPDRYRVVETNENQLSFVDMKTLRVTGTKDYPGSTENIDGILYVVDTVRNPTAMDYQDNRLVMDIYEYKFHLYGDKQRGEYKLEKIVPMQSYDARGGVTKDKSTFETKSVSQLFTNLMIMNSSKMDTESLNRMVTSVINSSSNKITWDDANYISGIRSSMHMENWMAHPKSCAEAYVYDKKMQRNVALKALTNITTISQMQQALQNGMAVLYNTHWEKIVPTKTFVPAVMTDQYYLDAGKDALILVFQPGDLAPYSEGVTYVVIPRKIAF